MADERTNEPAVARCQRLSLIENIVLRLTGLFIFFAPRRGADLLADIVVRTNEKVEAERRDEEQRVLKGGTSRAA